MTTEGPLPRPPLLGRLLLALCRRRNRAEIEADFLELLELRTKDRGRRYAAWRYCLDVLSLLTHRRTADTDAPAASGSRFRDIGRDVAFAVRLFARAPFLFGLAVAGLALAIGISTAVFSVINSVTLRDSGIEAPESLFRLVRASTSSGTGVPWTYGEYVQFARAATSVQLTATLRLGAGDLPYGESPDGAKRYIPVTTVAGNYFGLMGGRAALGRVLVPADDAPGAPAVALISYPFWKNRLGGDAAILGRAIRLGGAMFTVVGVASRDFRGHEPAQRPPALWISLTAFSELREKDRDSGFDRSRQYVDVFARLATGVTKSSAEAETTSIAVALAAERVSAGPPSTVAARLTSIDESSRGFVLTLAIRVLACAMALLVLLGSANVANLLLATAAGRRREIGTRLALGATRARIVWQLMTESLMLGAVGGAAGLAMSLWLTPMVASMLQLSEMIDVAPDLRVYSFVAILAVVVGFGAGLAPARYGPRGELLSSLNADQLAAPSGAGPGRLRSLLLGSQAAASIVLLVLAALLTRGLLEATHLDLGLDADRLMHVSFGFNRSYTPARVKAHFEAALERVRQLPDVAGASLALISPFEGGVAVQAMPNQRPSTLGGYLRGDSYRRVSRNETTAGYFETIGARVIRGRTYTEEEVRSGAAVAVISSSLAQEFWGNGDPIGSDLARLWGADDPPGSPLMGLQRKPAGTRIIGVVSDTVTTLRFYDAPTIYMPMTESSMGAARLVIAARTDAKALSSLVTNVLKGLDPQLSSTTSLVRDGLDRQLEQPRVLAGLAALFGGSAVTLAVLGLVGVTAFVAAGRRHEVSVRIALGATEGDVVRLLVRDSLRPVFVGLTCGLVVALLGGHAIRGILYGISGRDPVSIAAAVAILLLSALAAALGPARSAARVDPARMLKQS